MGQMVDISKNLKLLTQDIAVTGRQNFNLPVTNSKQELLDKIDRMRCNLASQYAIDFWNPIRNYLQNCQEWYFANYNYSDKQLKQLYPNISEETINTCHSVKDFAQVILQHSTNFKWHEGTCAIQQMICDMWNKFVVSSGLCTTQHCLAPIGKWGDDEKGPWALSKHHVNNIHFNIHNLPINGDSVPIISFPIGYAHGGILAWAALPHEIAHTILESGLKLSVPLSKEMRKCLTRAGFTRAAIKYWSNRVSEAGADVLGVLYMGPTAALGLISFLRAMRPDRKLSNTIDLQDEHPMDLLRALMMAYVVKNLKFDGNEIWFKFLIKEIYKDYDKNFAPFDFKKACQDASVVAVAIMNSPIIKGKSLCQIYSWNNHDEQLVESLIRNSQPQRFLSPLHFQSPHIISAANLSLLFNFQLYERDLRISQIFQSMIKQLENESRKQKELCLTCPLSQKEIYPICSIPPKSRFNSIDQLQMQALAESWIYPAWGYSDILEDSF